jgi:hypothetical protein
MWMVDPKLLCRKHLLGEHVECHMFVGTFKRGTSLQGYLDNKLLEAHNLQARHDLLALELKARGYKHKSPLDFVWDKTPMGTVNPATSLDDLKKRCSSCKKRIEDNRR